LGGLNVGRNTQMGEEAMSDIWVEESLTPRVNFTASSQHNKEGEVPDERCRGEDQRRAQLQISFAAEQNRFAQMARGQVARRKKIDVKQK
jgi:hypothetical protein